MLCYVMLLYQLLLPACNMYWEADITYYVWTGSANAYLFVVLDACDCDVVGDVFSDHCRALRSHT